jgi:hypothetical protein
MLKHVWFIGDPLTPISKDRAIDLIQPFSTRSIILVLLYAFSFNAHWRAWEILTPPPPFSLSIHETLNDETLMIECQSFCGKVCDVRRVEYTKRVGMASFDWLNEHLYSAHIHSSNAHGAWPMFWPVLRRRHILRWDWSVLPLAHHFQFPFLRTLVHVGFCLFPQSCDLRTIQVQFNGVLLTHLGSPLFFLAPPTPPPPTVKG